MKRLLSLLFSAFSLLPAALAQPTPVVKATQAEVDAGVNNSKFLTPLTHATYGGTNSGQTAAQVTNIVNALAITTMPSVGTNYVLVKTSGNDATAVLNSPTFAAATFTNALKLLAANAFALTNGTIIVPPGEYIHVPDADGSLVASQAVTVIAWGATITNDASTHAIFRQSVQGSSLHWIGGSLNTGGPLVANVGCAFKMGGACDGSTLLVEHVSPSTSGHDWILRDGSITVGGCSIEVNDVELNILEGADFFYIPTTGLGTNTTITVRNSKFKQFGTSLPIIKVNNAQVWKLEHCTFESYTNATSGANIISSSAGTIVIANCTAQNFNNATNYFIVNNGASISLLSPFATASQINNTSGTVTNLWTPVVTANRVLVSGSDSSITNVGTTGLIDGTGQPATYSQVTALSGFSGLTNGNVNAFTIFTNNGFEIKWNSSGLITRTNHGTGFGGVWDTNGAVYNYGGLTNIGPVQVGGNALQVGTAFGGSQSSTIVTSNKLFGVSGAATWWRMQWATGGPATNDFGSTGLYRWWSVSDLQSGGSYDTGMERRGAGIMGINTGTKGSFGELSVANVRFSTNSVTMAASPTIDITKVSLLATNGAFTFGNFTGIDTGLATFQSTVAYVTNSGAAGAIITFPGPANVVGTPYVTNLTRLQIECYASIFTNVFCQPIK